MSGNSLISEIGKIPNHSYINTHYFCDYVELVALLNNSGKISADDIYNIFLKDGQISEIGIDESSDKNDKWESRIDKWFSLLHIRKDKFGNLYFFILQKNNDKFSFQGNTLCNIVDKINENH